MATIRKRAQKYEVQIRRLGQRHLSKTFHQLKNAQAWARMMEVRADCHDLPTDHTALHVTLGELVNRYRDTVSVRKKTASTERLVLAAFGLNPICRKRVADLRTADFAAYRDDRLRHVQPTTLKRELVPIRHLFVVARDDWGLPIKESPLDRLQLEAPDNRRERRLRDGEFDRVMQTAASCRNTPRYRVSGPDEKNRPKSAGVSVWGDCLLANLIDAHRRSSKCFVAISLREKDYTRTRYRDRGFGYTNFIRTIEYLKGAAIPWVTFKKGFNAPKRIGRVSRYAPSYRFLSLAGG